MDRGGGDADVVVVFEVPGDRVAAGVAAFAGEGVAELEDQGDGRRGVARGLLCGRREWGSNAVSPSVR